MQVWVLSQRFVRDWLRNPGLMLVQMAHYIVISLFLGLLYHKLTNEAALGVFSRAGCIWYSLVIMQVSQEPPWGNPY